MSNQQSRSSDEQYVFKIQDAQSDYDSHGFDRYVIERSLGSGAMATVLLATDKLLDRKVAIKVPLIKSDKNSELIEKRFMREAQAAARLSHPNICPIHDVGLADGTYYISMAYIDGRPLNQIILETVQFSEAEVAQLVRKIASGVAEAHRQGFVHRDLKPGNIMIDQRGEPIILDFGLARFFDNSMMNQTLTLTGQTVGTPSYMSPEQAMGSKDLSPASDIFSLGVIMWELLCGERPFTGDAMTVLSQIVHGPSPSPRLKRSQISPEMEAICMRAIANKPGDRFQTMDEFGQALDDVLQGRKVEFKIPSQDTRIDQNAASLERERETQVETPSHGKPPESVPFWVWIIIGLLLLIIVFFMLLPMFGDPGHRPGVQNQERGLPAEIDLTPAVAFPVLDKNKDNLLDPSELTKHVIRRADADQDERLSFSEDQAAFDKLGHRLFDTPDHRPAPAEELINLWNYGVARPFEGGGAPGGPAATRRPPGAPQFR